ncbi:NAD-dependent epimerase/dehydratase family protein [Pseudovibrio sp. Ad37]|uniref:NAD-dependent epimerase/dehydratase family protein n=1 Tax=Pseudovibrio sp. Ad37 TaxID=989422 RepID=UPI0007AECE77|nr:NAD-dependent epimerase/dehydratase family protein [Pseudovibrio sp. Ad37]KZL27196.1 hypothetical protein PsAD37_01334 [Pseudovibrio sp. Ad37]
MKNRVAMVFGSTGLIGSEVVRRLLASEAYGEVHTVARKELSIENDKLHVHLTDFSDLSSLQLPTNVTDVFCCLGTTQKKAGSKEAFYAIDFQLAFDLAGWLVRLVRLVRSSFSWFLRLVQRRAVPTTI